MGDDGAADGRGDGVVDDLYRIHLAVAAKVLAHSIKNHHRLIHRITQHRQHRCQHGQRKLPLEVSEKAQDDDHIVQVGNDASHCVFPFKANGQINHDANHHAGQGFEAINGQLVAYLRPDKLGAPQLGAGVHFFEAAHDLGAELGRVASFGRRHADEHITRRAKILHLHIVDAQSGDALAHGVECHGLGKTYLHQGAAGELH